MQFVRGQKEGAPLMRSGQKDAEVGCLGSRALSVMAQEGDDRDRDGNRKVGIGS